jgi:hypothetical protein
MPARTPARRRLASRIAATEKSGGPQDPRLPALRRDLQAVKLEDHIREVVDGWPPLTDSQRTQLVLLLHPGAGDHAAT